MFLFLCWIGVAWAQNQDGVKPEDAAPSFPSIIIGRGNQGYIARFTSHTSIGNSVIFQTSDNKIGVGTTGPGAPFDVLSHIPAGGPTVTVENALGGDDVINFNSAGTFTGNLGVIQSPSTHFAIMQNGVGGMALTLAENGGYVGIGISDPTQITNILTIPNVAGPGGQPIANAWPTYSSKRWKTDIQPLAGALDKVEQLQGVSFNWKGNGKHDIGLVAEDVATVVPELVAFDKNGTEAQGIDYGRLTALLVEAIKEQQNEIRELKDQLAKLTPHPAN
jgi:hypothetical protein